MGKRIFLQSGNSVNNFHKAKSTGQFSGGHFEWLQTAFDSLSHPPF